MTSIEWTDETWNPIRGCRRVSEGCRNCYAERVASRFNGPGMPYENLARDGRWSGEVRFVQEHLEDPLRWTRPRRVFVNSMSDLFYESLSDRDIDRIFAVMALATRHTFQVLTKRPERMLRYMRPGSIRRGMVTQAAFETQRDRGGERDARRWKSPEWPLPNAWLGVSVENQSTADERIPLLLQAPAAVRFLSIEPLLGPVNLFPNCSPAYAPHLRSDRIGWVIVGGESGPNARPCDAAWIRGIVEQCREAGVPCFVKQLGANVQMQPGARWPKGWPVDSQIEVSPRVDRVILRDRKGGDPAEWPEDLRVREFPTPPEPDPFRGLTPIDPSSGGDWTPEKEARA